MSDRGRLADPDTGPEGPRPGSGWSQPSLFGDHCESPTATLVILTASELHSKKARILAEYPGFEVQRRALCCGGHAEDDIREFHGPEAARKYREYLDILFLLGDE